ncbi:OPT oligopeptide transporter protein-domain-containing protein [Schizophyllum amplum]|uniref:OPT oligopeptide transporter protein-domain-containing protein n=1 Tax=Schizophyllum amplum TaxID=97359 RepID=A0A550CW32_9AGAR|nr:OPT oligopeptide transporter protein-domain-containing protein [Auriculariopsis ampla]
MADRPTTASGRPQTAGGRPMTAASAYNPFVRDQQYTTGADSVYTDGSYEDEEEESDDEDVFAFLPPSTADAERQQQQQLSQQQPDTHHPVAYPEPAFDPYARFPADSTLVGASSLALGGPSDDAPLKSSLPPPQSPPSTASHDTPAGDGDFHMRRIPHSVPQTATGTVSSREVHVSLPPTASEKASHRDRDLEAAVGSSKQRYASEISDASGFSTPVSGYVEDEDDLGAEGSIKMEFDFDAIEEEDSPYPEVRASVSNIDDPDMPALTLRTWFIGLLLSLLSGGLNTFFNFRQPAPSIISLVLLLISYPFGRLLAFCLPITTYRIPLPRLPRFLVPSLPHTAPPTAPDYGQHSHSHSHSKSVSTAVDEPQPEGSWFTRKLHHTLSRLSEPRSLSFSLNPGPWSIKEHALVFIMSNVSISSPYALNAIVVSQVYYEQEFDYWFEVTLVLATQLTGFGLAGLCRRFLVWPASMVWPSNLVACTLLNTLHAEEEGMMSTDTVSVNETRRNGMTRYRYFCWICGGAFLWFFVPGFLFVGLSMFSYVCWAVPDNIPVNQLFGVSSGLGMGILSFDWTQISWISSPLMVPWWAQVHIFAGFVFFFWILTPILYYTNTWQLSYFPISANEPYDRFGNSYNISRVLTKQDTFDEEAYNNYSPLYLPATYAMTYLLAFALSTSVIIHTILYHGRTLVNGAKRLRVEADDIHAKLMRNYPEVPNWWYLCALVVFFSLAIVAVEVWNTGVPVYALLVAIILPILYVLPSGFIYAMTGQGVTINILAQIIPGTLVPGNPLANMVFKAYSVQTLASAQNFVQDLKLGHYVKVPPRATFMVQLVATVLSAFLQVGVKTWLFSNVEDICSEKQKSQLTCPHNQVFFTASAVWGLVGPVRQFGTGSIYHPHLYAMIVGAFLPLPFWFWQRRYPNSWIKYVSTPVVLNGVSQIPPATGINYSSWFLVGFIFQFLIRKRNFAWWSKFNYVTSAAIDSGTVLSLIFIFLTLQFPKGGVNLDWWGNTVFMNTADYNRTPLRQVPEGGIPSS